MCTDWWPVVALFGVLVAAVYVGEWWVRQLAGRGCPRCDGTGYVTPDPRDHQTWEYGDYMPEWVPCPECQRRQP